MDSRFLENVFGTVLFAYRWDAGDRMTSVTVQQPIMFSSNLKGLRRDSVNWTKVACYSLVAGSCGHDSEYLCDKVSLQVTVGVHIRICPRQLHHTKMTTNILTFLEPSHRTSPLCTSISLRQ